MRRLLGHLLCALLLGSALGACGTNDGGTVTDQPAPGPRSTPAKGATGEPVDFDLVAMVSETAAGGTVSPTAVPLADDTAVEEFAGQFRNDTLKTKLLAAVQATPVPDGRMLYAAVVSVGCDSPDHVMVSSGGSGLVVTARAVPSPQQECFAAVTTVALVLVPTSAVS